MNKFPTNKKINLLYLMLLTTSLTTSTMEARLPFCCTTNNNVVTDTGLLNKATMKALSKIEFTDEQTKAQSSKAYQECATRMIIGQNDISEKILYSHDLLDPLRVKIRNGKIEQSTTKPASKDETLDAFNKINRILSLEDKEKFSPTCDLTLIKTAYEKGKQNNTEESQELRRKLTKYKSTEIQEILTTQAILNELIRKYNEQTTAADPKKNMEEINKLLQTYKSHPILGDLYAILQLIDKNEDRFTSGKRPQTLPEKLTNETSFPIYKAFLDILHTKQERDNVQKNINKLTESKANDSKQGLDTSDLVKEIAAQNKVLSDLKFLSLSRQNLLQRKDGEITTKNFCMLSDPKEVSDCALYVGVDINKEEWNDLTNKSSIPSQSCQEQLDFKYDPSTRKYTRYYTYEFCLANDILNLFTAQQTTSDESKKETINMLNAKQEILKMFNAFFTFAKAKVLDSTFSKQIEDNYWQSIYYFLGAKLSEKEETKNITFEQLRENNLDMKTFQSLHTFTIKDAQALAESKEPLAPILAAYILEHATALDTNKLTEKIGSKKTTKKFQERPIAQLPSPKELACPYAKCLAAVLKEKQAIANTQKVATLCYTESKNQPAIIVTKAENTTMASNPSSATEPFSASEEQKPQSGTTESSKEVQSGMHILRPTIEADIAATQEERLRAEQKKKHDQQIAAIYDSLVKTAGEQAFLANQPAATLPTTIKVQEFIIKEPESVWQTMAKNYSPDQQAVQQNKFFQYINAQSTQMQALNTTFETIANTLKDAGTEVLSHVLPSDFITSITSHIIPAASMGANYLSAILSAIKAAALTALLQAVATGVFTVLSVLAILL